MIGAARRRLRSGLLAVAISSAAELALQAQGARLPDPIHPDVIARLEAGRPAEALDLLDRRGATDTSVETMLLRARILGRLGRHREAATLWETIATREPATRELAEHEAIDQFASAGDLEAAATRLAGASSGPVPPERLDLSLRVATLAQRAGENARAAELYRRVLRAERRGPRADSAYSGLASVLESAGQLQEALDTWRTAGREFSAPEAFGRARTEERRLAAAIGRSPAPFTTTECAELARRLRQVAGFSSAIAVLEEWRRIDPAADQQGALEASIVENLFDLRSNAEARTRALGLIERNPPGDVVPAMQVMVFRVDVREGRTPSARARGLDLWRGKIPGASDEQRRFTARLLAAYLVSVGDVEPGAGLYEELAAEAPSRSEEVDSLWRLGVIAIRLGQFERAETALRRLVTIGPGDDVGRLAQYWLGHVEEQRGEPRAAAERWGALAEGDPYSYYGIRAARRLRRAPAAPGAAGPGSAPAAAMDDWPESVRALPEYRLAVLTARAGLRSDSAAAARRLASATRDRGVALAAARASAAAGDHRAALLIAQNHFGASLERAAGDLPADVWQFAYPLAFESEVRAAADRFGVDPLLLFSLMRQESRFDPRARSAVGAIGLFQLMPTTAARLAPAVGMPAPDTALLMEPATSATLGAKVLSDLTRMFEGSLVPVIASYNAGEDRVSEWWQAGAGLSDDLFIDSMPYSETRRYVREVLANQFVYQTLYGAGR
jgi:soluble lytic murein transglycosylase